MKQMNKNKLTRISILIASLWVSSYQNLGAQGLKLQGLTAPPGGEVYQGRPRPRRVALTLVNQDFALSPSLAL